MMKKLKQLQKELAKEGYYVKPASELINHPKQKTGLFSLDYVLDGGICMSEGGHRIEFFGMESSGKTTFALYVIKKYQELGKTCAFIDAEMSYDKAWAEKIGVNNDELLIIQPTSLEEAGDLLVKIIPQVDLLVIDSIVSLIPLGESERETEKVQVALSARINALIVRKLYHAIAGTLVTTIFINQIREKVGVMFGSPLTTPGGKSLKHFYNSRLEFKAGKPIEIDKEKVGVEIKINCVKNKKGKPYRKTATDFYFNGHVDDTKNVFYAGIKYGIIEKAGAYYTYGEKKECGYDKFCKAMTEKEWEAIQKDIWKRMK